MSENITGSASSEVAIYIEIIVPVEISPRKYKPVINTPIPHCGISPIRDPNMGDRTLLFFSFGEKAKPFECPYHSRNMYKIIRIGKATQLCINEPIIAFLIISKIFDNFHFNIFNETSGCLTVYFICF